MDERSAPGDAGSVCVHLLRPGPLTPVAAGGRINGVGWVACDRVVGAVEIFLGAVPLGRARLGLSPTDLTMLTGQAPSDATIGFVFAVTMPDLPPGPVTLRLRVRLRGGDHDHDVGLILVRHTAAAEVGRSIAGPRAEPLRAAIETARIDERGILRVVGWAAGLSPVTRLTIHLGDRLIGTAQHGLTRDDVAATLPDYPNAAAAGFLLQREASDADLAQTELRLVATAQGGVSRSFTVPLQRPERLRRRAPDIVANLVCEEVRLAADGLLFVKGWAVASSGVAEIRVELDAATVGTVVPDEDRPDVGNRHPRIAGAARAGFRLERRLTPEEGDRFAGDHVVRLSLRGRDGEENACFQPVAVTAIAGPDLQTPAPAPPAGPEPEAIRCYLDTPACQNGFAIETVRGFLSLAGWAFGRAGVDRIEVFVDGISQGRAHHGIRREDLQAAFPDDDALRAGFAMMLPPQVMKPGIRAIRVEIRDKAGRSKEISFSVRAETAATGPGPWMPRTKLPQAEIDLLRAILLAHGPAPDWTILLPLADAAPATVAALSDTLDSLRWQACEEWSLVLLAPIASAVADIDAALRSHGDLRPRIRILPPQPDRALADLAAGFLVPLAPGDRLGEDALLELGIAAGQHPAADFLYSDERRIDPSDGAEKAFFKPDFSPDLLLSTNYIGRIWAATRVLLARAGLTEADLRHRGHYDAVLRLTEQSAGIHHVDKVLCARGRAGDSQSRQKSALRRALRRRRIRGTLHPGPVSGAWRLQRAIPPATRAALVSIIIPTIAARGCITTAIESIRARTAWPAYEIVCLDNIPRNGTPEQRDWKAWIAANADRTVEIGERFNWSRFNNRGAKAATGAFLLFLNDDIEIRDPLWLHGLVEHAQRPEIGVVGPQLLYPDGRVQHAGVFLARRAARHAFRFYPADEPGPFGLARMQRDVISVTGACMMMRRAVFDAMRGFDEAHAVVNNDLDFNLRVREAGLGIVHTPAVTLTHHEMVSRAELADAHDLKAFAARWGDLFAKGDPFFSRHLSPDCDDHQPDSEPVRPFAAGHPLIARNRLRRILALKLDHIGDFVTAFPVFRRIKQRFPEAELTVLCAAASLSLAALEPAIDRVIEFNFFHARSEKGRLDAGTEPAARRLAKLRDQLAPHRFDLAIDLRRQPDTRPILQVVPARWRAGFDAANAHPWLDIAVAFEGDIATHRKRAHVTDSLFALVDAVSAQCEPDRAVIADLARADPAGGAAARRALIGLLPAEADVSAKNLVCLHTGAGALNKQWPAASFAALIDLLVGEANATTILVGGPDEAAFAKHVIGLARRKSGIVSLVGRSKLRDLPALLRGADLYVGNDSGPKHIAAAVGIPTIGIHSGTVDAVEWGGMGPNVLTIRRDMRCSPCYLVFAADCHRNLACLDGIRVGDVYAECRRLLALSGPAR